MNNQQAIEELKFDCEQLGKAIPCDTGHGQAINMAYGMAIEALEKQIPKKPKKCDMTKICPECAHTIKWCYDFCTGCGQAIDWSN